MVEIASLVEAIGKDDHLLLQSLLKDIDNIPEFRDDEGNSLLHLAIKETNPCMVKYFLQAGCDVNGKNNANEEPLMQTMTHNYMDLDNPPIVKLLVEAGANLYVKDKDGNDPFNLCFVEDEEVFDRLDEAKILLEGGCNVNTQNNNKSSPVHKTVARRWKSGSLAFLLSHNADPNLKDENGNTPLHLAVPVGDFEDVYKEKNRVRMVQLLLKNGANVNLRNLNGKTPFHKALSESDEKVIELLLNCEVDFSIRDRRNRGSLHFAAKSTPKILELILERGVDFDEGDTSPLHIAVERGSIANAKILCAEGANINKCNLLDRTPLLSLFRRLLINGCWFDFDMYHCEKLVEFLLDEGADINTEDLSDLRPFDIVYHSTNFAQMFLRMVARYEFIKEKMNTDFHEHVKAYRSSELYKYFESCKVELQRLKDFNFSNNTLIFPIFLGDGSKILKYVKNAGLVEAFYKVEFENFPIYGEFIKKQFSRIESKHKLKLIGFKILKECLPKHLQIDVIVDVILSCFTIENLIELVNGETFVYFNYDTEEITLTDKATKSTS